MESHEGISEGHFIPVLLRLANIDYLYLVDVCVAELTEVLKESKVLVYPLANKVALVIAITL